MSESTAAHFLSIIGEYARYIGVFLMSLLVWKNAKATDITHEQTTSMIKHVIDWAGVSLVVVAVLDIINPLFEWGIIALTFVWMVYRIIEIRINIKAKKVIIDANKTPD